MRGRSAESLRRAGAPKASSRPRIPPLASPHRVSALRVPEASSRPKSPRPKTPPRVSEASPRRTNASPRPSSQPKSPPPKTPFRLSEASPRPKTPPRATASPRPKSKPRASEASPRPKSAPRARIAAISLGTEYEEPLRDEGVLFSWEGRTLFGRFHHRQGDGRYVIDLGLCGKDGRKTGVHPKDVRRCTEDELLSNARHAKLGITPNKKKQPAIGWAAKFAEAAMDTHGVRSAEDAILSPQSMSVPESQDIANSLGTGPNWRTKLSGEPSANAKTILSKLQEGAEEWYRSREEGAYTFEFMDSKRFEEWKGENLKDFVEETSEKLDEWMLTGCLGYDIKSLLYKYQRKEEKLKSHIWKEFLLEFNELPHCAVYISKFICLK